MKGIKKKVKYQGVSLPITLIDEIRKHVKSDPKYRSIGEFVRESTRYMLKAESNPDYNKLKKELDETIKNIRTPEHDLEEINKIIKENTVESYNQLFKLLNEINEKLDNLIINNKK